MAGMDEDVRAALLSRYYREVHAVMLAYQSHTLGLFPRGKSHHARVKDNVYCAAALWCFSLGYRQVGDDKGRTHELEQSAVKCMRGLLFCYMRQADKVERFKCHQSWEDALHSRFDYMTGDPVVTDDSWGHLQIDGTSLYLLILAQMTASGVQVIFTMDEVDFIQNLVYYVERAYRIPDYGMWERGSRDNVGRRELHASSIGMAKVALEAMDGLNLFGDQGSSLSIIHADPDAQYRNCLILDTLLPKESSSKQTDASLLCITGYPAFAIDNFALCKRTEDNVKKLLEGGHGFKRFIWDGHHTVREDKAKKYYDPAELNQFEGIECEWPLFFLITVLTEFCRGNREEAEKYWKKFEKCLIEIDGQLIVPRLFSVLESELSDDGGVMSMSSIFTIKDITYGMEAMVEDIPFQWAQALHFTARLMRDGLITVNDMDPLGLHLPHHSRHRGMARHLGFKAPGYETIIQVALIAETTRLQAILATHGIPTQTSKQVEPIKIRDPGDLLITVYSQLGKNSRLGLSGRPNRPIGALGTSRVYRILGHTVVFYPTDSMLDFYTSFDVMVLIDVLKSTLQFLSLYWNMGGRPTLCLYLTETRLSGNNFRKFVNFLAQLKQGEVDGVKVRVDRLQALITTSCVEHLECGKDDDFNRQMQHRLSSTLRSRHSVPRLSTSSGSSSSVINPDDTFAIDDLEISQLEEQETEEKHPDFGTAEVKTYSVHQLRVALKRENNQLGELYLLNELMKKNEKQYDINMTIEERVHEIYEDAGTQKHWMTVRMAASLLRKVVDCLAPSLTSILVREKEVTVGVFGYSEYVISEPMGPKEIVDVVYDKCFPYDPIEAVLQQEIIIHLADFMTSSYHDTLFDGMLRIRIGWFIQAMKNELRRKDRDQVFQQLSPYELKQVVIGVLRDDDTRSALQQRQLNGALNRVPPEFYAKVFNILEKVPGGIHVGEKTLPQVPTIYEVSVHEKNFAIRVEEVLSNITFPEYRQAIVEVGFYNDLTTFKLFEGSAFKGITVYPLSTALLMVVSTVLERNPEIVFHGVLNLDDLLQDSMMLFAQDSQRKKAAEFSEVTDDTDTAQDEHTTTYACHRTGGFYTIYPDGQFGSASYMAKAVVNKMLQEGLHYDPTKSCSIS